MGYASSHINDGCGFPIHGKLLAAATAQLITSDPIPRQLMADMAEAVYDGVPNPHPEVDNVPLGNWGGDHP